MGNDVFKCLGVDSFSITTVVVPLWGSGVSGFEFSLFWPSNLAAKSLTLTLTVSGGCRDFLVGSGVNLGGAVSILSELFGGGGGGLGGGVLEPELTWFTFFKFLFSSLSILK